MTVAEIWEEAEKAVKEAHERAEIYREILDQLYIQALINTVAKIIFDNGGNNDKKVI